MSKEIAQTVGGKRIAWLLAIVAAFAVFGAVSTQWKSASAQLPQTIVEVDMSPDGPATVTVGTSVTYVVTAQLTLPLQTTDGFTIELEVGAGLADPALTCTSTSNGSADTVDPAPNADCTWDSVVDVVADTFVFTLTGTITSSIPNPLGLGDSAVCADTDSDGDCTDESGLDKVLLTSANDLDVDMGTLTTETASLVAVSANATNVLGEAHTFTFTLDPGVTCASDADALPDGDVECTVADVNPSGDITVQSVSVAGRVVSVTVLNSSTTSTGGTVSLDLTVEVPTDPVTEVAFTSPVATKTYVSAELRHMSDTIGGDFSGVIGRRDVETNVRNSRHTVCTVAQNTGIDFDGDGVLDGASAPFLGDVAPAAVALPGLTLANIVVTNGGGYASTIDTDPTFSDVRIFIGDGTETGLPTSTTTAGLQDATCISWVSLDAGDQSISLVYVGADDGLNYSVHWDTDGDANDNDGATNDGVPNTTLVKEWNRLEDSELTINGVSQGTTQNVTRTVSVALDPSTGLYTAGSTSITDIFRGSHTNSAGQKEGPMALAGVNWSVSLSGCGQVNGFSAGTDIITGVTKLNDAGAVIDGPDLSFTLGNSPTNNCGPNRTAVVTIKGWEPGPLGSGTGITVTETVTFNFTTVIPAKKVFLAWAGQRVILEHDWRIQPGDTGVSSNGPTPVGSCPFLSTFGVTYIKGGGPGNFLTGLGATLNGSDQATVTVQGDNTQSFIDDPDIPGDANGSCISRVLFESEDQGQVDIEAFVVGGGTNVTKHAFVVYYMKINTVTVKLATQFSKPSHNSSSLADWSNTGGTGAPTNPWNSKLDDADNAAEWNVSKDLLVRGRVTGWFVNSNPSGRPADDSNPLNVLPANRWVMPEDWAALAGGPKDVDGLDQADDPTGTAEQFRPYYDIMFAPNNARGTTLASPSGTSGTIVAAVATGNTGVGSALSPLSVSTCAQLPAGAMVVWVGTTNVGTVTSCAANLLVVTAPLLAPAAAGTNIILVSGVPFEGPYSTIDIVGLASQGLGGAALSDFVPGGIRDTALADGDVDSWDAPMPPAPVSVSIRGTGFIKQVLKQDVYYLGTPNSTSQTYTNPFYIQDIPDSPFIPAVVVGGGYFWDTWGPDGPGGLGQRSYTFWTPAIIGTNSAGIGDSLTTADSLELGLIRAAYGGDNTIARDLVVYSDNHGEFMVAANGDFKTDLTACQTNVLAGGKHCAPGDKVGTGTITATVDYPDFRGKHFPVLSNAATVDWTWGGYKDVTVVDGETDQFKYIVFHGMDRDGFCSDRATGAVLLHSILGTYPSTYKGFADDDTAFTIANLGGSAAPTAGGRYANDPIENVDFLIDSGEGIIIGQSGGGAINDGKQFATGVLTFSTALNDPAVTGIQEFDPSPLAGEGQTDECQAWIKVSNSLLGVINILAIAHDDEGNIGFDRVIDLTNTHSYTLTFRWSLITWVGADAISVNDAITGTGESGQNPGGNPISASVTAIYGWDAAAQQWLGFFPSGVNVPGANDLTALSTGDAYWVAITGPSSVTWTVASNVN